jgi:hypothetical protein
MKVTILMVVLWSMFAGHSYGEELARAPKSPEESLVPEAIMQSLEPISEARLLSLIRGEEKLLERTPTSLFIGQEAQSEIFDQLRRGSGEVTRSPAVMPKSLEVHGQIAK